METIRDLAVIYRLDKEEEIKLEIIIDCIDKELKKQLPFKKEYEVSLRDHLGKPERIYDWLKNKNILATVNCYYISRGWSVGYYSEYNAFLFIKVKDSC